MHHLHQCYMAQQCHLMVPATGSAQVHTTTQQNPCRMTTVTIHTIYAGYQLQPVHSKLHHATVSTCCTPKHRRHCLSCAQSQPLRAQHPLNATDSRISCSHRNTQTRPLRAPHPPCPCCLLCRQHQLHLYHTALQPHWRSLTCSPHLLHSSEP